MVRMLAEWDLNLDHLTHSPTPHTQINV